MENGLLGSAYKGADGALVLVLVNLSSDERSCDLGFVRDVNVYTTSPEANLATSRQNASTIKIPARAVATVRSLMP